MLFGEEEEKGTRKNRKQPSQIIFNVPDTQRMGGQLEVKFNDEGQVVGFSSTGGKKKYDRGVLADEKKIKDRSDKKRSRRDDDEDDSDESDESGDDDYTDPTEKPAIRTWLRLFIIAFFAIFVAGILPGQALFIRMLADYGIYSSACEDGKNTCMKQQLEVPAAFRLVGNFAMYSLLPVGYMFDRCGGRTIASIGAFSAFLGVLMIQVPLWGASNGYDKLTSRFFPVALTLTDVGNQVAKYCVLSMVYHFPNSQMLLLSLMVVQEQSSAVLPNIFQYFQQLYQLDLPMVFAIFAGVEFVAFVGLALSVPSQREYFRQAKKALGRKLEFAIPCASERNDQKALGRKPTRSTGFWHDVKKLCRVISYDWFDHAIFCVAVSVNVLQCVAYLSLVGEYIQLLWGSQQACDDFAALVTVLIGTLGAGSNIVVCILADRAGTIGFFTVMFLTSILFLTTTINTLSPTSFSQYTCLLCNICSASFSTPLFYKYTVAYAPPNQLGLFNGLLWTGISVALKFEMSFFFEIATSATTAMELGFDIMILNAITTVLWTLWATRTFIKGLPRKPPMLHENGDLAQSFL